MNPTFHTGKLPLEFLQELLAHTVRPDPRLVTGPRVGEDVAVIDMGDRYMVVKTDPITFAVDNIGWYVVHVNANDIATSGARPMWMLNTLLLPEKGLDSRAGALDFRAIARSERVAGHHSGRDTDIPRSPGGSTGPSSLGCSSARWKKTSSSPPRAPRWVTR